MSEPMIDNIPQSEPTTEDKMTDTETLKLLVCHERNGKLLAQRKNIEAQLSQVNSEIAENNANFNTLKIAAAEKYKVSKNDSFDIISGKITRVPVVMLPTT